MRLAYDEVDYRYEASTCCDRGPFPLPSFCGIIFYFGSSSTVATECVVLMWRLTGFSIDTRQNSVRLVYTTLFISRGRHFENIPHHWPQPYQGNVFALSITKRVFIIYVQCFQTSLSPTLLDRPSSTVLHWKHCMLLMNALYVYMSFGEVFILSQCTRSRALLLCAKDDSCNVQNLCL